MTNSEVLLIHGPNLGLLGRRKVGIYGVKSLKNIEKEVEDFFAQHHIKLVSFQSNHEGALVDFLNDRYLCYLNSQETLQCRGLIINAGAYTHTSVAIRDALEVFQDLNAPIFEVHISNVFARETFRHHSFISPLARGVICGLGTQGYLAAARSLAEG